MDEGVNLTKRIGKILTPAKTIPHTPWTAKGQWQLSPLRFLILIFGLFLFGFGEALLYKTNLGNSPWAVFSQGIAKHTNISIGWATFFISAVVLILWLPLGQFPGLGTVMNMIFVATAFQIGIDHFPAISNTIMKYLIAILGIAVVGLGSGFYITCGLGPGPRDGLMTALHKKTKIRVGRVRLVNELIVFVIGWFLGGTVGVGTALFALLIGNSVAFGFKFVSKIAN